MWCHQCRVSFSLPFPVLPLSVTALGEASCGQEPSAFQHKDLCKADAGRSVTGAPSGAEGLSAGVMGNKAVATVNSSTPQMPETWNPQAGKDWREEEKGTTEDEMIWWHHRLNRQELKQVLGDGEGQGNQVCCNPWDHKVSNMTKWLNNNSKLLIAFLPRSKCLLILSLQSPSTVILEPQNTKSVTVSIFPHLFAMKWWARYHELSFLNVKF